MKAFQPGWEPKPWQEILLLIAYGLGYLAFLAGLLLFGLLFAQDPS